MENEIERAHECTNANEKQINATENEVLLLEKKLGMEDGIMSDGLRMELKEDGYEDLTEIVSSAYTNEDYQMMASQPHMMKLLKEKNIDALADAVVEWKRKHKPQNVEKKESVLAYAKEKKLKRKLSILNVNRTANGNDLPVQTGAKMDIAILPEVSESSQVTIHEAEKIEREKYVPPSKRNEGIFGANAVASDSQSSIYLKRKLHNLINKIAESNIDSIAKEVVKLYGENSRGELNGTLGNIILDACSDESILIPALLMCSSALISYLHAMVGFEIGAFFIEKISHALAPIIKSAFVPNSVNEKVSPKDSHRCSNLTLFITHFYNFKIIDGKFLVSFIKELCASLSSLSIELLLLLLTRLTFFVLLVQSDCSGQLRKEDPVALKDIIVCIQENMKPFLESIEVKPVDIDERSNTTQSLVNKLKVNGFLFCEGSVDNNDCFRSAIAACFLAGKVYARHNCGYKK